MLSNYAWYRKTSKIFDPDLAHQVLAYGGLEDIKEIKNSLGPSKLKEIFLRYPKKVYTKAGLNFIVKFILKLPDLADDDKYLKSTPRITR